MRLIDADTLNYVRVRIYHDDGTIGGYNAVVPSSEIKNAPTVDAVPVIRCKDCKHQKKYFHADRRRKDGGYNIYWCDLVDGYAPLGFDDEYCAWAERRNDETD